MMKKLLLLFVVLCPAAFAVQAKAPLKFSDDGQFKILHLSDLHFVFDAPEQSAKTFARMDYIVREEKPDFIAITGDVVYGRPAREMFKLLLARLDSY